MSYLKVFSMTLTAFMIGLAFGFTYSRQIRLACSERNGLWGAIRSLIDYISGRKEN